MPDITMHSSYWSIEPSSGQMFCSSKHISFMQSLGFCQFRANAMEVILSLSNRL